LIKQLSADSFKSKSVKEKRASCSFWEFFRVWVKVLHWSMKLKCSVKQDH